MYYIVLRSKKWLLINVEDNFALWKAFDLKLLDTVGYMIGIVKQTGQRKRQWDGAAQEKSQFKMNVT